MAFTVTDGKVLTRGSGSRRPAVVCELRGGLSRRDLLGILGLAMLPARKAQAAVNWAKEEMCKLCGGRGIQMCSFCAGSGLFFVGDEITGQTNVCPNCTGRGRITCPKCVGLGLRNVKGVLRDGSNDGTLRVRRDGSIEILNCDAYPSCSAFGDGGSA